MTSATVGVVFARAGPCPRKEERIIKVMVLLPRPQSWTRERFHRWWLDEHVSYAKKLPDFRKCDVCPGTGSVSGRSLPLPGRGGAASCRAGRPGYREQPLRQLDRLAISAADIGHEPQSPERGNETPGAPEARGQFARLEDRRLDLARCGPLIAISALA